MYILQCVGRSKAVVHAPLTQQWEVVKPGTMEMEMETETEMEMETKIEIHSHSQCRSCSQC